MKKILLFLLCLAFTVPIYISAQTEQNVLNSITEEDIFKHLDYLSSNEMLGRDTPSDQLDICALYIAKQFKKCGLTPPADTGSYLQYFYVLKNRLAGPNLFNLSVNNKSTSYKLKKDFIPIHSTANRTISAEVVFAGYGITAPEYNYNDYKNLDVTEKAVLIFTNEPCEKDSSDFFEGKKMTDYSKITTKVINARKHGAVAIIIVTNPNNHRFLRPPNIWPSLMRHPPEGGIPLSLGEKNTNKIVAVRIGKKLAANLISTSKKNLSGLQTLIDSTHIPQSFELPSIRVKISTTLKSEKSRTQNVIGLLQGTDPELKEEIIAIGAHYDHLGFKNDSTIYNGADDNASGTVGVMEIAWAFTHAEIKPLRSILFCTWAGEEKGLFGSRYYADNSPLFPLENTVTYINLDMIGRNDSSKVSISGINTYLNYQSIIKTANKKIGIQIKELKGVSRSDHVPFYDKKVPVLGFFTGFHDDYHKPTDTIEKCSIKGIQEICRLIFNITHSLSTQKKRPQFMQEKQNEKDEKNNQPKTNQ